MHPCDTDKVKHPYPWAPWWKPSCNDPECDGSCLDMECLPPKRQSSRPSSLPKKPAQPA